MIFHGVVYPSSKSISILKFVLFYVHVFYKFLLSNSIIRSNITFFIWKPEKTEGRWFYTTFLLGDSVNIILPHTDCWFNHEVSNPLRSTDNLNRSGPDPLRENLILSNYWVRLCWQDFIETVSLNETASILDNNLSWYWVSFCWNILGTPNGK